MKINIDQNESNALEGFASSGANYVKVIEKIFKIAIDNLKDITQIDPKDNMGLQTLSRQLAVKELIQIKDLVFPNLENIKTKRPGEAEGGKVIPKYR